MNTQPRTLLSIAVTVALWCVAHSAEASEAAAPHRVKRNAVEDPAKPETRFASASPEVRDGHVLAGKKTTEVKLDEQSAIANNELRQMVVHLPGLLVSEQQIPGYFNMNYRGLGDPHESEFVMVFEDGVPLASGWFGVPALYYLPPTERLERVAFVRGGSSLLYGPQPGPAINLVTRTPSPAHSLAR